MSQLAIPTRSLPAEEMIIGEPGPALRLVESGARETADRRQQWQAFTRRCEDIALRLATSRQDERIAAYAVGAFTSRELSTAAALRPDLMPTLNGEWEWIALKMADLD